MITKSAWFMVLSAALVGPALAGCTVHAGAGGAAQGGAEPPPPAPPPEPAPTTDPAPAPTTPPAQTSTASVKGDSISIPGNIVFDTNKSTLKEGAGSEKVLEQLKLFLVENPQVTKLRVEGHTDNVGQAADNMKLSGERALTIKRWLVDNGIAKDRVVAVGFGMTRPIADNATDAGKAQNRRTEFRIAELGGKKYLNQPVDGNGTVFDY